MVFLVVRWGAVRRVSEEARDLEQAFGVGEGAAEPAVVLLPRRPLDRPSDVVDPLGAVPPQLALQLLRLRALQEPPQVQLRPWKRTRQDPLSPPPPPSSRSSPVTTYR